MFKGVTAPDGPKHPTRHQDVYGQMQMKPCKMITGAENLVLCGASVTEKNPKKNYRNWSDSFGYRPKSRRGKAYQEIAAICNISPRKLQQRHEKWAKGIGRALDFFLQADK